MAELSKQDLAFIDRLRDEFNAQPRPERFRTGRSMTLEAVMELLRERQHAQATVARIEARIATVLDAERRREPAPQPPAGMEPNYCNAEQCTCRMGFGYVACDQQPKWKPARGVAACPACGGNDKEAPCAFPEGGQPGCLRDKRLAPALAEQIAALPARFPEKVATHPDNMQWWRSGFVAARDQAAELARAAGVAPCDAMPDKIEAPSTDASETVSAIYRALSRGNNLQAQRLAAHYLDAKHERARNAGVAGTPAPSGWEVQPKHGGEPFVTRFRNIADHHREIGDAVYELVRAAGVPVGPLGDGAERRVEAAIERSRKRAAGPAGDPR